MLTGNVVLAGVAVATLVRGGFEPAGAYPFPGSEGASEYIEAELRGDAVLVTQSAIYIFAVATDLPTTIRPTPDQMIGFTPVYDDRRIRTMGTFGEVPLTDAEVAPLVEGARRVFVRMFGLARGAAMVSDGLTKAGFELVAYETFEESAVAVWARATSS